MAELVGGARINGYIVQVLSEKENDRSEVPRHPVEEGVSLTDHVERQPLSLSIDGILTRPTPERLERLITMLKNFKNNGDLITYEGRKIYTNMLIEALDIEVDASIANGYKFSMSLVEARIPASQVPDDPQLAPEGNAGQQQTVDPPSEVYHTVKKGDTLWGLGQKYGVPWQTIQELNGNIDPKRLQIGQKLRVK